MNFAGCSPARRACSPPLALSLKNSDRGPLSHPRPSNVADACHFRVVLYDTKSTTPSNHRANAVKQAIRAGRGEGDVGEVASDRGFCMSMRYSMVMRPPNRYGRVATGQRPSGRRNGPAPLRAAPGSQILCAAIPALSTCVVVCGLEEGEADRRAVGKTG